MLPTLGPDACASREALEARRNEAPTRRALVGARIVAVHVHLLSRRSTRCRGAGGTSCRLDDARDLATRFFASAATTRLGAQVPVASSQLDPA